MESLTIKNHGINTLYRFHRRGFTSLSKFEQNVSESEIRNISLSPKPSIEKEVVKEYKRIISAYCDILFLTVESEELLSLIYGVQTLFLSFNSSVEVRGCYKSVTHLYTDCFDEVEYLGLCFPNLQILKWKNRNSANLTLLKKTLPYLVDLDIDRSHIGSFEELTDLNLIKLSTNVIFDKLLTKDTKLEDLIEKLQSWTCLRIFFKLVDLRTLIPENFRLMMCSMMHIETVVCFVSMTISKSSLISEEFVEEWKDVIKVKNTSLGCWIGGAFAKQIKRNKLRTKTLLEMC